MAVHHAHVAHHVGHCVQRRRHQQRTRCVCVCEVGVGKRGSVCVSWRVCVGIERERERESESEREREKGEKVNGKNRVGNRADEKLRPYQTRKGYDRLG